MLSPLNRKQIIVRIVLPPVKLSLFAKACLITRLSHICSAGLMHFEIYVGNSRKTDDIIPFGHFFVLQRFYEKNMIENVWNALDFK